MYEQLSAQEEDCHECTEHENARSQHLNDTSCDHCQGDVSEDLLGHVQPGWDRKLKLIHLWGFILLLDTCIS